MKAKFLKLAGVKNEEEFYKKFPTEESFMAKHGKKLQKAAGGIDLSNGTNYLKPKALNMPKVNISAPKITTPIQQPAAKQSWTSKIGDQVKSLTPQQQQAAASGIAGTISNIGAGISQINSDKRKLKELEKYGTVSGIVAQAAGTRDIQQHQYVFPTDVPVQNANPTGTGTDYLQAANGTEIQNTYAPDVIYTDLGYEPLAESTNKVKAFKKGGKLKKADLGSIMSVADTAADLSRASGDVGGALVSEWTGAEGETGGYTKSLGGFGLLGGALGAYLDAPGIKKRKAAQGVINMNTGVADFQDTLQTNSAFQENGGWVSHDWQPQVITSFGQHSMKSLLQSPHDAEMLRAGGHLKYYTPPSGSAMYTGKAEDGMTMAICGDLEVGRGKLETLSYNPYLPNNGQSLKFVGPRHNKGGMPMRYGNTDVEAEGDESGQVMEDGGNVDSFTIFGNMKVSKEAAEYIGDPEIAGVKYKTAHKDMSGLENKQNNIIDKSTDMLANSNPNNKFEQAKQNSFMAMELGAKMKLKDIANMKIKLGEYQNGIHELANHLGVDPAKLAEGKAEFGGKLTDMPVAKAGAKSPFTKKGKAMLASKKLAQSISQFLPKGTSLIDQVEKENDQFLGLDRLYPSGKVKPLSEQKYLKPDMPITGQFSDAMADVTTPLNSPVLYNTPEEKAKGKPVDWYNIGSMALATARPFITPRYNQELDPRQLGPELAAKAMNTLEPVPMQRFNPLVPQMPGRISLQDKVNEITAQSRAAEKMALYNPEAASTIFASVARMKSDIMGEQMRLNQAQTQAFLDKQADVLNSATLKNLELADQQAVRMAEAKSKTKAQDMAIYKSITNKYAQNDQFNRAMNLIKTMTPSQSFTSEGVGYKDPFYLTNIVPGMGTGRNGNIAGLPSDWMSLYDETGDFQGTKRRPKQSQDEDSLSRNGKIVKAFKNF